MTTSPWFWTWSFLIIIFLMKRRPLDDYNRVVLDPEDGVADSDYVNASYVDVSHLCTVL